MLFEDAGLGCIVLFVLVLVRFEVGVRLYMLDPMAAWSSGIATSPSSISDGVKGRASVGRTPGSQTLEPEPGGVSVSEFGSSMARSESSGDFEEMGDDAMMSLEAPGEDLLGALRWK